MHAHAVHLPLNSQVILTHQRIPVFILEWDYALATWTKIASLPEI